MKCVVELRRKPADKFVFPIVMNVWWSTRASAGLFLCVLESVGNTGQWKDVFLDMSEWYEWLLRKKLLFSVLLKLLNVESMILSETLNTTVSKCVVTNLV